MAVTSGSLVKLFSFLLHCAVITVGEPAVSITMIVPSRPRVGEKVSLICIYSPRTSVKSFGVLSWWRNGTRIVHFSCPNNATYADMCNENVLSGMNDTRISFAADAVFSGNLTISELQASDSGNYTCHLAAQSGVAEKMEHLNVKIPDQPEKPKISGLQHLREGIAQNITCTANGVANAVEPSINWDLAGQDVSSNASMTPSSGLFNITSTLRFYPTYRYHKALLSCELRLNASYNRSEERLNISYAPRDARIHKVTHGTMSITLPGPQYNVTLKCTWKGNPRGEAAWLFAGEPLKESDRTSITNLTGFMVSDENTDDADRDVGRSFLTISNVQQSDYGGYHCNVTSPLGQDVAYYNLSTLYPPYSPINFTVIPSLTTSSSLHVAWQRGQGSSESGRYIIRYCKVHANEKDACNFSTGVSGENATIDDLSAFTLYNLSILATNDAGNSSEVNATASTAPLSPVHYGITVHENLATGEVKLSNNPSSRQEPVPHGVCFIVRPSRGKFACSQTETCVKINSSVMILNISKINFLEIVSYGRELCSEPYLYKVDAAQSQSPFTSTMFISAVAVGGSLVIILLVVSITYIVMCAGKRTHKDKSTPELTQVREQTSYRRVDDDGLVYIDVSHDVSRPKNAPPIQTESPTIYANINSDTLRKKRDESHGSVRTGNESTNGSGQSDGRTTDSDGLIYIDISHNKERSLSNTKPIRTEEETIYADLKPDAMRGGVGATSRSDEHSGNHPKGEDLLYIDLSHDNTHPSRPRDNPIRTEEQTIYADLNTEAMKLQKEERQESKTTDGARTKDNRASEMDRSNVGSVTSDGANLNYSSSDSTRVDVVDKSAVRLRHLYIC